jgi:hypothetical protein
MLEAVEELERSERAGARAARRVARSCSAPWELDPDLVRVLVREVARSPQLGREVDEIEHAFAALSSGSFKKGQERASRATGSTRRFARLESLRRARGRSSRGWVFEQPYRQVPRRSRAPSRTVVELLTDGLGGGLIRPQVRSSD